MLVETRCSQEQVKKSVQNSREAITVEFEDIPDLGGWGTGDCAEIITLLALER